MRTGAFAATQWIERLAEALAELAETQKRYPDDLNWWSQQRTRSESVMSGWRASDHPSDDLGLFYLSACSGKDRYYVGEYSLLCAALAAVRRVLALHPAWADFLDPFGDRDEIWIQIFGHGSSVSLLSIISGLMARGLDMPEDGFRVAAAELHGVLDPGDDPERMPGPDDLSVGYHVALFHGLRMRQKISLADDMALLPFEQLGAFVNESVLQDVAPMILRFNDQQSVGALVQSFHWKPAFRKRGDGSVPALDWGASFFEDAGAFVALLALFHAAPIRGLVTIPYCLHRTALSLLGQSNHHANWSLSARSLDMFADSTELRGDALDAARKAFGDRKSDNYKHCAPIIARLAEALKRSGQFQIEDMILDVAIALERMYELEGGEISFKLKTRAAYFLETSTEGRQRVFRDVKQLYNARSAIVHRRKKPPAAEAISDALTRGFEVARRSVVKLLRDGPPPDWNELVLAGTESGGPKSEDGEGTP